MEVYDEKEDMVDVNDFGSGFIISFGKRFRRVCILGAANVPQPEHLAKG